MPITAVTYQPNTDSLNSAYRPFVFRCKAQIPNATTQKYICPVVYCDIYVEGIYYKTISRTQFIKDEGLTPEYEFDIQDAVQELMDYNLPKMDGSTIEEFTKTIKKIFIKFRNAYLDSNGFATSEQPAPTQGTSSVQPIPGGGTKSNEMYVLNSAIQHEETQDLNELLNSYKTGTWGGSTFPLTKRPQDYKICKSDSSHFPIVSAVKPKKLCIKAKKKMGEIIDLCVEILDNCPIIQNIQYTITKHPESDNQSIKFTWTNPPNMIPVPYDFKVYYKKHGTNDPWATTQLTAYPNPITDYTQILPFGYYDFVFEIIGLGNCKLNDFSSLPHLDNIGSEKDPPNHPPTVLIRWNDNLGNEDRVCTQSVCSFTIETYATDQDNDIINIKIMKSTNNGVNWNVFIANQTQSTFDDSINTVGKQQYKAIVTDAMGNIAESNILSYEKQEVVVINPMYRKAVPRECFEQGWENGHTGGTAWCSGYLEFTFASILNASSGYVRLKINGDNNELGLQRVNSAPIVIDQVMSVNELFRENLYSSCSNVWPCAPTVDIAEYKFEFSQDGSTNWQPFLLYFF